MTVTEQDRERAREVISQYAEIPWDLFEDPEWTAVDAVAAALADERERARAPFLAYADKCAAIGNDRKAGVLKRAVNRSVAQAFRRAAEENQ